MIQKYYGRSRHAKKYAPKSSIKSPGFIINHIFLMWAKFEPNLHLHLILMISLGQNFVLHDNQVVFSFESPWSFSTSAVSSCHVVIPFIC